MTDLPPANSWQSASPCSTDGPNNPSIVYSITLTAVPATIGAAAGSGYVWSVTLNDGGAPPNFTIDRFDGTGTLVDHPIEISGSDGSTQFNDPVYLSRDPLAPLEAATKQYADALGFPANDAPATGGPYVRNAGAWTPLGGPYFPASGGYLSGAIGFNGLTSQRFIVSSTPSPGNLTRWMLNLGDTSPESGSNAGSNFVLTSYNDLGQGATPQLTLTRNGAWTVPGVFNVTGQIVLGGPNNLIINGGNSGDTLITNGSGGLIWGQSSGGGGISDAPIDGQLYGRQSAAWTVVPPPPIATDAPSNASTYGRSGGAWVVVPPPVITTDAPATSQLYGRYNNGWVQVSQQFVATAGGAMTGPLIFNGTPANRAIAGQNAGAMRWALCLGDQTPETGGNSGSNWTLQRYNDAGALIDTPVTISRASGQMTVANPVTVPNPPPGDNSNLVATTSWVTAAVAAVPQPQPPSNANPAMNGTAAPGTSLLYSRGDHVHPSDTTRLPMAGGTITGTLGVNGILTAGAGSGAAEIDLNGAAGSARSLVGRTNGSIRWIVQPGNASAETGSNAGSDFSIARYSDAGATIDQPLIIVRSNGGMVLSSNPQVRSATQAQVGVADAGGTQRGAFYWQQSTGQVGIGNTATQVFLNASNQFQAATFYNSTGTAYMSGGTLWTNSSDDRIKTVLGEYDKGLDEVLKLRPVAFVYKGNDTPTARLDYDDPARAPPSAPYPTSMHYQLAVDEAQQVGFIAQELEQIFPGMVNARPGFIDGEAVTDLRDVNLSNLLYALVNSVKTLAARVAELEASR